VVPPREPSILRLRDGSQWHLHIGSILIPALSTTFSRWRPGQKSNPRTPTLGKLSNKVQPLRVQWPTEFRSILTVAGQGTWYFYGARGGVAAVGNRTSGRSPGSSRLVSGTRLNRHISGDTASFDPGFAAIARWTIVQNFGIIGLGSHTDFCVQPPNYFVPFRGGAHETKNRTTSSLPCELGN
jgi:hypothetical protein